MKLALLIIIFSQALFADDCYFIPSPLVEAAACGGGQVAVGIPVYRNSTCANLDYLYPVPQPGGCFRPPSIHLAGGVSSECLETPWVSCTSNPNYGMGYCNNYRMQMNNAVGYIPHFNEVTEVMECEVMLYKGPHNGDFSIIKTPDERFYPKTVPRWKSVQCKVPNIPRPSLPSCAGAAAVGLDLWGNYQAAKNCPYPIVMKGEWPILGGGAWTGAGMIAGPAMPNLGDCANVRSVANCAEKRWAGFGCEQNLPAKGTCNIFPAPAPVREPAAIPACAVDYICSGGPRF